MTIETFRDLVETHQYETLWAHDVMVGDRLEGDYRIILYQIFDFYIELYYHIELNVLRKLVSFDKLDALDIYLKQFNITTEDLN